MNENVTIEDIRSALLVGILENNTRNTYLSIKRNHPELLEELEVDLFKGNKHG